MDDRGIQIWYERYKTGLYRYALTILKNEQAAEDVLQETFLKLLTGKGFPEPGKEQAWLYRVARNLCYDHLRRMSRIQPPETDVYREHRYAYIELTAPLRETERQIVTLKIVGGLSHREIGEVLGISARAAQKRYERAIATLREGENEDGK